MKLLTKAIRKKLPKLYANDGKDESETIVIVKFFDPCSNWTWYATEGEPVLDDNDNEVDFTFFGYVVGNFSEFGYFSLNELKKVKNRFGLGIERDMYFKEDTLENILKK